MQHVQEFEPLSLGRAGRPDRAGVRRLTRDLAPTSTFVAVETAVLVMVAALAMTSIIVTADDPDAEVGRTVAQATGAPPVVVRSVEDARRDVSHVAR